MDLNDTFETNDAPEHSDKSHSSACKHSSSACTPTADAAHPEQHHQPGSAPPPDAEKPTNNPHQFGRDVALAMACMDAAERLRNIKADKAASAEKSDKNIGNMEDRDTESPYAKREEPAPTESDSIPTLSVRELSARLHSISAEIDTQRAELIGLLVQFDEQKGWETSGARNCADWCNARLGIAISSVYEFLRVGRELQELPVINSLFRGGELSWSKVKHLTRVADADNERDLAHVARDATVSDVERICKEFSWSKSDSGTIDPDTGRTIADLKAERQFNNRSFTRQELSDGSVQLRIKLPPEQAEIILKSLELCVNELYESNNVDSDDVELNSADTKSNSTDAESNRVDDTPTATQRRADAMVLMAERSLQHAGKEVSRSDRFQVILHVENSDFVNAPSTQSNLFPAKVPWIEGVGPIADSVASRIACDASIISMLTQDGEPLNMGRKSRTWPAHIRRAILARDRHCQFPGCSQHRYLDVHHIEHWANGGENSVENGICLCQRHHTLVHQEGYIIERNTVETNMQPGSKDFGTTIGLVSPAQKALLPTRYRFRFIKPLSKRKKSECCENQHDNQYNQYNNRSDNQCNESHVDYRISRHAEKSPIDYQVSRPINNVFGGTFSTWRNEQEQLDNHRILSSSRISEVQLTYH